ncbi:bifunctional folylpolyglutamate synthase/dihydrofolate synthase [Sporolactobacillus vineae]|uniref:bifunctional folylpolyglutamate synthase/dihydrofolate synthase n=1 Tax=Sporolactobacillus vineae TaxID=444463 RepID=UPI00028914F3|nr:folylpolyglutamate synthase/dihydrofolate synthase family protein [Sporolactobacillus vineae]
MFTKIDETLQWIHGLIPHGMKPGTQRMEWMLARIGNPEHRIRAVHVGGTNGKGSTVSYLRHIYQQAGLKVGTFISPYITSFNERIMINGVPISDEDLIKAANIVYPLTKAVEAETDLGLPAEFETVTMLSFVYFGKMNPCDLVIYEVGLGGRLDSTNVIHPLVSVITNVAMDHMKQLGNTITSIAREKAGIIKNGVGIITTAEHPDALKVIREQAKAKQSNLYVFGSEFTVTATGHDADGEHFNFDATYLHEKDLILQMRGVHQLKNAAAALMTVDYLDTFFGIHAEDQEIRNGLRDTAWPGRFEQMSDKPRIIIDGAHNVQGTEALVETVHRYYPGRAIHVLYAALKDKQYEKMVQLIETVASEITLTTIPFPRAAGSRLLYDASRHPLKREDPDWKHALNVMINGTGDQEVLLICGSLYFISLVRAELLSRRKAAQSH